MIDMSVLRFGSVLGLVLALAIAACGPVTTQPSSSPAKGASSTQISATKYAAFHDGMRKLWSAANIRVYGGGASDANFLEKLTKLIGDYDITSSSVSYNKGERGTSRPASITT